MHKRKNPLQTHRLELRPTITKDVFIYLELGRFDPPLNPLPKKWCNQHQTGKPLPLLQDHCLLLYVFIFLPRAFWQERCRSTITFSNEQSYRCVRRVKMSMYYMLLQRGS